MLPVAQVPLSPPGRTGNVLSLGAIAVDHFGGGAFTFLTLLFLARIHGIDVTVAGAVLTTSALLSYALIAPIGHMVALLGGRQALLIACGLGAIGYACYLWNDAPIAVVAIGAFLVSCNERVTATSWPMLAVERLGREKLHLIFAAANTIKTLSLAAGAVASSVILARYGNSGLIWALALNVITFGIAAVLLLLVRDQPVLIKSRKRQEKERVSDALRNPPFRRLVLSQLALSGCWIVPVLAFPVYLTENLGQSASLASAVVAVRYGLVTALQIPFAHWVGQWPRNRILTLAVVLAASGLGATHTLSLLPSRLAPLAAIGAVVLIAMSEVVSKPAASASAVRMANPGSESSYLAVFQVTWSLAYTIGPVLVGVGLRLPVALWIFLTVLLGTGAYLGRERAAQPGVILPA